MDGQYITPSSGTHAGAETIDYQMPFQTAGSITPSLGMHAIGNHDQYWMGIGYPTPKIQQALVGSSILTCRPATRWPPSASEGVGMYVGTVDGTTPFGTVIKWGPTNLFDTPRPLPPTRAATTLTTDNSSPTNYVNEFFNTTTFRRDTASPGPTREPGSLLYVPTTDEHADQDDCARRYLQIERTNQLPRFMAPAGLTRRASRGSPTNFKWVRTQINS